MKLRVGNANLKAVHRRWGILVVLTALAGCAMTPTSGPGGPEPSLVPFFFVTDRARSDKPGSDDAFGSQRGTLHYGQGIVSIAPGPMSGTRPTESVPEYLPPDAGRTELESLSHFEARTLWSSMAVERADADDHSVLVYIHGYGRDFTRSARSLVRVAHEMQYRGTPILYSWPASRALTSYVADGSTIEWTTRHLREFLTALLQQNGTGAVHVVAHSMGNRALLNALADLADAEDVEAERFGEIVLLAPDVDRQIFERDLLPPLAKLDARVTLYVSAIDIPLLASKMLHIYPRLGDGREELLIVPGVETVDTTAAVPITQGHAYYRENTAVIADLHYLIARRLGADHRPTLEGVAVPAGRYWKVRSDWQAGRGSTGPPRTLLPTPIAGPILPPPNRR